MNWIKSRLKEPSTWAGLAAVAHAVGVTVAQSGELTAAGLVAGVVAVLMKERA